jgi:hypothetical protein
MMVTMFEFAPFSNAFQVGAAQSLACIEVTLIVRTRNSNGG